MPPSLILEAQINFPVCSPRGDSCSVLGGQSCWRGDSTAEERWTAGGSQPLPVGDGQDEGLTPGATLPSPVAVPAATPPGPSACLLSSRPVCGPPFYPLTHCLRLDRDEDLQPPTCSRGLRGPRVSGSTPVRTRGSPTRFGWSPHR